MFPNYLLRFLVASLGSPMVRNISFAFSNLSGNKTTLLYLFNDLSILTTGTFFLFNSFIVVMIQIYRFFLFTKNDS